MTRFAIVTGASGGIGAEVAVQLAQKPDYKVGLIARRRELLEQVAKRCRDAPTNAKAFVATADVTDEAAVKKAFADLEAAAGQPVDVVVNNAGGGSMESASQLTPAVCEKMMKLNLYSVMYAVKTVLPAMKERKSGMILNVSSIGGRIATFTFCTAYAGAKHFLNAYTESLRAELKSEYPNIKICTASPGPVSTDFFTHAGVESNSNPDAESHGEKTSQECAASIVAQVESGEEEVYTDPADYDRVMGVLSKYGKPKPSSF